MFVFLLATSFNLSPVSTPLTITVNEKTCIYTAQQLFDIQFRKRFFKEDLILIWRRHKTDSYEGPQLLSLLEHCNNGSFNGVKITSLDDTFVIIPFSDLTLYRPIVAVEKNGGPIPLSSGGPWGFVYPIDEIPQLKTPVFYRRMIWQIKKIETF